MNLPNKSAKSIKLVTKKIVTIDGLILDIVKAGLIGIHLRFPGFRIKCGMTDSNELYLWGKNKPHPPLNLATEFTENTEKNKF